MLSMRLDGISKVRGYKSWTLLLLQLSVGPGLLTTLLSHPERIRFLPDGSIFLDCHYDHFPVILQHMNKTLEPRNVPQGSLEGIGKPSKKKKKKKIKEYIALTRPLLLDFCRTFCFAFWTARSSRQDFGKQAPQKTPRVFFACDSELCQRYCFEQISLVSNRRHVVR